MDDVNFNDPNSVDDDPNEAIIDKLMKKHQAHKESQPVVMENLQTQSMVQSTREEANAQLAAIEAQNNAIIQKQKTAENVAKAEHTGAIAIVVIILLVILGVGAWLGINAYNASRGAVQSNNDGPAQKETKLANIKGYACQNQICETAAIISDSDILIRDGSKYYTYNVTSKQSALTNIPEEDYHAITPFVWNGVNYLELDPESSLSAIYAISENRQLTDFSFDEIYKDINDSVYEGIQWINNKYILTRGSGNYRLLETASGNEAIKAAKRIYARDDCFYGYENDGSIYIYNSSYQRIHISPTKETIFTYKNLLVIVNTEDDGYQIFNKSGEEADDEALEDYLGEIDENYVGALRNNKQFNEIPANQ